jgi:hypothetical protein
MWAASYLKDKIFIRFEPYITYVTTPTYQVIAASGKEVVLGLVI